MVETIPMSKLTKQYISSHSVICNGVHCIYKEMWSGYSGATIKKYVVFNTPFIREFKTLKALKEFITNPDTKKEITKPNYE